MTTRDITCGDCGRAFTVERGQGQKAGRWPTFCPPCRRARDQASNRRKQYRWRDANPERWKATQDRSNVKRLADPEFRRRKREAQIRRQYGIEPEELEALVVAQQGLCAICHREPNGRANGRARSDLTARLHVDHCHKNGHVRGLLCGNCNTMLGLADDDPAVLARAIEYLNK